MVKHGDVAALVLQVHMLTQALQRSMHPHVGVGELCKQTAAYFRHRWERLERSEEEDERWRNTDAGGDTFSPRVVCWHSAPDE